MRADGVTERPADLVVDGPVRLVHLARGRHHLADEAGRLVKIGRRLVTVRYDARRRSGVYRLDTGLDESPSPSWRFYTPAQDAERARRATAYATLRVHGVHVDAGQQTGTLEALAAVLEHSSSTVGGYPERLTVSALLGLASCWQKLDVPIYADLAGSEVPLRYRGCDTEGLHLAPVDTEENDHDRHRRPDTADTGRF